MKIRVLNLAFALAFALFASLIFPAVLRAQTAAPEAVVKTFYNGYINRMNKKVEPLGKNSPLKKYLSALLTAKKIDAFESKTQADYFFQSQEYSDDWENKFVVSKPFIKGAIASAIVAFPGEYPRVKVTLKQEAGAWKIAYVEDASR